MYQKKILINFLFLTLFLFSCSFVGATSPAELDCQNGFTRALNEVDSIEYKRVVFNEPRYIVAHIVKVDLNDSNLDISTTPRELLGNTTTAFAGSIGAAIAINGMGFENVYVPSGYNAGQGVVYGDGGPGDMVFSSSEENDSQISYSVNSPIWDVLSGFNLLIDGGDINPNLEECLNIGCPDNSICSPSYCTNRARTTIGMDQDNHLIIIVVDEVNGATLFDMATMQNACGSENSINLDGGGSSTLAVNPTNLIRPGYNILNTVASERIVSNHLAICIGSCETSDPIANNLIPEGRPRPRPLDLTFPFECDNVAPTEAYSGDNEFHSLRPYQASPCNTNKENLALFCGNDLFIGDYVTVVKDLESGSYTISGYPIAPSAPSPYDVDLNPCWYCGSSPDGEPLCLQNPTYPNCVPATDQCWPGREDLCGDCISYYGHEECIFTITSEKDFAVDVSGAEFPIMGYTEPSVGNEDDPYRVTNSTYTDEETMDHATKMNEYVSWYLNGVNGRAEYPYLDPSINCVGESTNKVGQCRQTEVNDSGELKCLTEWPFPISFFTDPFVNPTLQPDGKSVCAGDNIYCCVNKILSTYSNNTPGSGTIVNYSGPIKKLLPFSIQNIERTQEVSDGYESDTNDADIRHSQVVGCHFDLFAWVPEVFGDPHFIIGLPIKCYGYDFFGISLFDFLDGFDFLDEALSEIVVDRKRLTNYNENTPPIEDEEEYLGEDFSGWIRDYKEWRGYACISLTMRLPIIGDYTFNICYDHPLEVNIFGNLFSYVPFSSTEDRLGDIKIKSVSFQPAQYSPRVRIISSVVSDTQNANMFVPHMEETTQLAEMAQKLYAYQGADTTSMEYSGFVPDSPYCDLAQVRSNPGDQLFAGKLSATVNYTAQMTCEFLTWGDGVNSPLGNLCENLADGVCVPYDSYCETSYGEYDCGDFSLCCLGAHPPPDEPTGCSASDPNTVCVPVNYICTMGEVDGICPEYFKCVLSFDICTPPTQSSYPTTQSCTSLVMGNVKLETRTPLAHIAWARLVAGSSGVFRKMFPKLGQDSTFEGIFDMPASTNVSYSNVSYSSDDGIVYAGAPANQTSGTGAQLYFPHIGGIKEYFLTGIQTLLRPKGMGRQPVFCEGDECLEANDDGVFNDTDCIPTYDEIYTAASAAEDIYGLPDGILTAIFEIEALPFINDSNSYVCEKNPLSTALGLMQIIDGTYDDVACSSEIYTDDVGICDSEDGMLSRCDVEDAFILAARVLLSKVGCWDNAGCTQICNFPSNVEDYYAPVCAYYGSCNAGNLTTAYCYNMDPPCCNTTKNYCDIVVNKMGGSSCTYSYYCPY